jgi:hypothetical protein
MNDGDAWFVRSAGGLSYFPVRWPGWLLLLGFIAAVMGLPALLPGGVWLYAGLIVILTIGFVVTTVRTSRPAATGGNGDGR